MPCRFLISREFLLLLIAGLLRVGTTTVGNTNTNTCMTLTNLRVLVQVILTNKTLTLSVIVAIMAYLSKPKPRASRGAARSSSDPVSPQILQMLEQLGEPPSLVSSVDEEPDMPQDFQGVPIPGNTPQRQGKYDRTGMTLEQIYRQDKEYCQWVRDHIKGPKSSEGMKRLRVYIAFVDQNKQNRLEMTQNHQMPVAKPQVKKKATRGRVRGHQHLEETDMEWEIAEVIHGVDMAHRWGDLTGRLVEREENKHQARFQRILEHPQGVNMLNHYLRG